MKRKLGMPPKNQPAPVPIGHAQRFGQDIEQSAAEPDVSKILSRYRKPADGLQAYTHAPRGGRIVSELEELLTLNHFADLVTRDRFKTLLMGLKEKFHLPKWYDFYPRDRVPVGGSPYDEDFVRVENFTKITTAAGSMTFASGFAQFDPDSGAFSTVGYSMGSAADVRAGPIVTMITGSSDVDISLSVEILLDYRYQLWANLNPSFQPPGSAWSNISVELDLLLDIDIRTLSGGQIGKWTARLKPVKHAELRPDSTSPPYVSGYQEIVSGNSLQGGALSVPIHWQETFAAPAKCRVRVGVAVAPFVRASGYRGSPDYRYLGTADGRAFGQVTSVHAILFS